MQHSQLYGCLENTLKNNTTGIKKTFLARKKRIKHASWPQTAHECVSLSCAARVEWHCAKRRNVHEQWKEVVHSSVVGIANMYSKALNYVHTGDIRRSCFHTYSTRTLGPTTQRQRDVVCTPRSPPHGALCTAVGSAPTHCFHGAIAVLVVGYKLTRKDRKQLRVETPQLHEPVNQLLAAGLQV